MDWRFGSGDFFGMEEMKRCEKTNKTAVCSVKVDSPYDDYWADGYQDIVRGYVNTDFGGYGILGDFGGYSEKRYTGRNIEIAAVFYAPSRNSRKVIEIGKQVLDDVLYMSYRELSSRRVMEDRECEVFLGQMLRKFANAYLGRTGYPLGLSAVVRLPVEGDFCPDNFGIFWTGTARVYMLSSVGGLQLLTEDTDLFPDCEELHVKLLQAHEVADDSFLFTVTENVYSLFSSPLEFEKFLLKHLLTTQKTESCDQLQDWVDAINRELKNKFKRATDFAAAFLKTKTDTAKGHLQAYEARYRKLYQANEEAERLADKILKIYMKNGRASRCAIYAVQDLFQQYQKKKEELQQFETNKSAYREGFAAVLKKGMRMWKSVDTGTETLDLEEWKNHVQTLKDEQEKYKEAAGSMDIEQMQQSYETVLCLFEQQKKLTDALEEWNPAASDENTETFVDVLLETPKKLEELTDDWNLAVTNWNTFERKCEVKKEELQKLQRELKNCLMEEVQNTYRSFPEAFFTGSELTEEEANELKKCRQKMQDRQKLYECEYLVKYQRFLKRK